MCWCDSEQQGSSLQLQLQQTAGSASSVSRVRTNGQSRQSARSRRVSSPYHHQSRDNTYGLPPLVDYYTSSYPDRSRYYYYYYYEDDDEAYDGSTSSWHTDDDRLVSTANSLVPYHYTPYCSDAVHSSVIVRRQTADSDHAPSWSTSCCQLASDDDQYGTVNGYTSVIVTTPDPTRHTNAV